MIRVLCLGGLLVLTSCAPPEPVRVVYNVTGSAGSASLTIQNAQGGSEQMTVGLPWTRSFTAPPGTFVYVSAQNQDDHGTIACEITADGVTVQSANSSGAYVIAGCSGST